LNKFSLIVVIIVVISQSSAETHNDGSMLLPPEGHFPSFKALETYAQNHAQHYGYMVVSIQ
jgi:hypothetical protein